MVFQTLLAQEQVKKVLQGIGNTERIAGGYIFAGPEQCGKTTAAIEFIKLLNCTGETKPCHSCPSCLKIASGSAVDFYQMPIENTIKIEQIRELKKQVQYGPYDSKFLAILIPQADKFTIEAANSFLKLLEEPPANVFFILETARIDAIPRTILSRCQVVNFSQLTSPALLTILETKHPEAGALVKEALRLSGGLLAPAELYLNEKTEIVSFLTNLEDLGTQSYSYLIDLADSLAAPKDMDKAKISAYLGLAVQYFRNTFRLTHAKIILEYLNILQKNVNTKLSLTALFFRLKEADPVK